MDAIVEIKKAYEGLGLAVLDVQQIANTPLYEMEFIGPGGPMKRKVAMLCVILPEPDQCQHPL